MKLLSLTFRNLNSLRGDHRISFADGPLARAGVFAITGRTGAGKTTILDALTLALYGRAARYQRQQPVEIMTRHTGECFAEAHFECGRGAYGARWELRRSRGQAEGGLQPVKRVIYKLETKEVVVDKVREADQWIAEHTGLDYERFLRSVLLAQGEFTAFLRAGERERGQLLENLTGMAIYAKLSQLAFQVAKEKRQVLSTLESEFKKVILLTPEERRDEEQKLAGLKKQAAELRARIDGYQQRLVCLEQWLQLQERTSIWAKDQRSHLEKMKEANVGLSKLELHQRTEPHAEAIRHWKHACRETESLQQREKHLVETEERLKAESRESAKTMKSAAASLENARRDLKSVGTLLERVLPLDERIRLLRDQLQDAKTRRTEWREKLRAAKENLAKRQGAWKELQAGRAEVKTWLEGHDNEAKLHKRLPDWERQLASIKNIEEQLEEVRRTELLNAERRREIASGTAMRRSRIEALEKQSAQVNKAMEGLMASLNEHLGRSTLADWEDRQRSLHEERTMYRLIVEKSRRFSEAAKRVETLKGLSRRLEDDVREANEKLEASAAQIEAQERVCLLHRQLAQREREIHQLRVELREGEACPVCGSMEHDAPASVPPLASCEDLEEQESLLAKLHKDRERYKEDLVRLTERLRGTDAEMETLRQEQLALEEEVYDLQDGGAPAWQCSQSEEIETRSRECEAEQIALDQKLRIAREINRTLEARKEERDGLTQSLQQSKEVVARERGQLQELEKSRETQVKALRQFRTQIENERSRLLEALRPYCREFAVSPETIESCVEQLSKQAEGYRLKRERADSLERLHAETTAEVERTENEAVRLERELVEVERKSRELEAQLAVVEEERRQLAGARSLLVERGKLERQERDQLVVSREAEEQHAVVRERSEANRALLTQTQTERSRLESERETWVGRLQTAAQAAGFSSLGSFLSAHLNTGEAQILVRQEKALRESEVSLASRRKELDGTAAELLEKGKQLELSARDFEDPDLRALRHQHAEADSTLEEAQRSVWNLEEKLARDVKLRQEQVEHQKRLKSAKADQVRWDRLAELIGSADGSAFSRFAQGLTLARLVELANRHMSGLTDRYRLRRQPGTELAIEVVDLYQANVVRSMMSLSGGESFLASLSLALGLSELTAGHARIDSLFIDEGFGTLDSESLEIAIRALENLQAQNKTIGIISHTELLKERITAQIRVHKGQGGVSHLEVVELTS